MANFESNTNPLIEMPEFVNIKCEPIDEPDYQEQNFYSGLDIKQEVNQDLTLEINLNQATSDSFTSQWQPDLNIKQKVREDLLPLEPMSCQPVVSQTEQNLLSEPTDSDKANSSSQSDKVSLFKCKVCVKVFNSIENVTKHITKFHNNYNVSSSFTVSTVNSEIFHENFIVNSSLKSSTVNSDTKGIQPITHQCSTCSKYFPSNNCLHFHLCSINKSSKFLPVITDDVLKLPCLLCDIICSNYTKLWDHTIKTHNACRICNLQLGTPQEYAAHEKSHSLGLISCYKCKCCELEFMTLKKVMDHLNDIHPNKSIISYSKLKKYILKIVPNKYFICAYCDLRCLKRCILIRHLSDVHRVIRCGMCKNHFIKKPICKLQINNNRYLNANIKLDTRLMELCLHCKEYYPLEHSLHHNNETRSLQKCNRCATIFMNIHPVCTKTKASSAVLCSKCKEIKALHCTKLDSNLSSNNGQCDTEKSAGLQLNSLACVTGQIKIVQGTCESGLSTALSIHTRDPKQGVPVQHNHVNTLPSSIVAKRKSNGQIISNLEIKKTKLIENNYNEKNNQEIVTNFSSSTTSHNQGSTIITNYTYKCRICCKLFVNNLQGETEAREAGLNSITVPSICTGCLHNQNRNISIQDLFCKICNNKFDYESDLVKHKLIHRTKRKFDQEQKCVSCNARPFINYCSYALHNKKHIYHGKKLYNPQRISKFKCEICFAIFSTPNSFYSHCSPYTNYPLLVNHCTICDAKFKTAEDYSIHSEKFHKIAPSYSCKICRHYCANPDTLMTHVTTKHNLHMVHCIVCNKDVPKHCYFESHKCLLNADNNSCSFCKLSITEQNDHSSHLENHTKRFLKPSQCKFCLNYFPTRYNCILHVRNIHSVKEDFSLEQSQLVAKFVEEDSEEEYANNASETYCSNNDIDNETRQFCCVDSESDQI